ncbi:glyoxalase [Siccirubricoccus deserti]|uniref:Glyoxalase n=1 Tax=Siccirubricoccus deserti TaxID=2013562 RepID=A0A9X0R6C7_9PROT|nr:VOC family protein [Siccirubricoccus deserti]MBC4019202.1 glyoxalase [Siccirubricoccus deserti]GGC71878.1 glyoxalase [Siccirubricoccus deserti]
MGSNEGGPILGLDHITLAVDGLDAAMAAYETLFAQPCDGRGTAEGLEWARFALANTSLVLVAPHGEPSTLAAHLASRPAGARAALGALGFAVAEPESAARLLGRRGLPAAGPPLSWLDGQATPLTLAAARGLHLLLTQPGPTASPTQTTRLDHVVIRSGDPERSMALLAGRLGLELRLDRSNPAWGSRLLFFRCGDLVVEVSHELAAGITDAPDRLWGLTWGVPDVAASHFRMEASGVPVSPLRVGRKPGTRLFTIRDHASGVPTAFIGG